MVDSSTHLNKLLYVAERVWPELEWDLIHNIDIGNGKEDIVMHGHPYGVGLLEPRKPTERGRAQLMDIVFAITSSEKDFDAYELVACLSDRNAEAIINLASEVLE